MKPLMQLFAIAMVMMVASCSTITTSRRGADGEEREISRFTATPWSASVVRADEYTEHQIRMGKLPGGEEREIARQRVRDANQSAIDNMWQRTYSMCMRVHYRERGADRLCAERASYGAQFYMLPNGGYYVPSYYGTPVYPAYPLYTPPPRLHYR